MTAGVTDITGFSANTLNSTEPHQLNVTDTYTAPAGREFYAVSVFANSSGVAGQQCEVGLYDITSLTSPYDGAELIGSATITHNGIEEEITVALGAAVELTEGNTYACAVRALDNGSTTVFVMYRSGFESNAGVQSVTTGAGGALADPWDGDTTIARRYAAAALTQPSVSPPTLVDVNTDEDVEVGETGVTITVSDFGSDINSATITDGTNVSAFTNLSGTGDSYTVDAPDLLNLASPTSGAPLTSASHSLTVSVTDGTDTDSLAITYSPPTGYAVVELASVLMTEGSVTSEFVGTPPDTSQILYPTANNTSVATNGIFSSDAVDDIEMVYWDAVIGNWQPFTVIIPSGIPWESRQTWQDVYVYLSGEGYALGVDGLKQFLADEGYDRPINDALYAYFGSLGYTGALPDRIYQWRNDV